MKQAVSEAVPEHRGGCGAAIGQFWGTILKMAIGAIMVVMLAIAALV
jgi:hypothetical protein